MAHGHGGVGGEQQRGHRLAEQVGAPDDDGLGTLERDPGVRQQLHHTQRSAGPQPGAPEREQAGVDRGEPVDVLLGVDDRGERTVIELTWKRQLQEDAAHLVVAVQALQLGRDEIGGRVRRQAPVDRHDADLDARSLLGAHVHVRRGVVTDQHGREPGGRSRARGELAHPSGHFAAHARGDRLAIDDRGPHRVDRRPSAG